METRDTISPSARVVLTSASSREDRRALAPDLPVAAQRAVLRSLLQRGLLEEYESDLRITPAGLAAAGVLTSAAIPANRAGLRSAAQAAVAAWEAGTDLEEALTGLRTALGTQRSPRAGTKRAQILALLCRPEGASGTQIVKATGWAAHTVRGFLAGLQRQGSKIEVLQRVRQVGPGKTGSRVSYSIYRLVDEA